MWDSSVEPQVLARIPILVLGRGNAGGLPLGKQAAVSSAVPLSSPIPSVPNCACLPCSAGLGLLCPS